MTGTVVARDPDKHKVRVQFPDHDNMVSDWLPVGVQKSLGDFDYWLPDLQTQVACLMDENYEFGVVVCAIYSDADLPPISNPDLFYKQFKDGTNIQYDRAAHKLSANVQGDVELTTTGTVTSDSQGLTTIKAAAGIVLQAPSINMASYNGTAGAGTINGTLHVTGNITGDAEVRDSVRTMSGDRAIYNGHTHPENGEGGGTTNQPNQGM